VPRGGVSGPLMPVDGCEMWAGCVSVGHVEHVCVRNVSLVGYFYLVTFEMRPFLSTLPTLFLTIVFLHNIFKLFCRWMLRIALTGRKSELL